jgi:hypothetical protein
VIGLRLERRRIDWSFHETSLQRAGGDAGKAWDEMMSDTAKTIPVNPSIEQMKEMVLAQSGKRGVFRPTGFLIPVMVEEVDLRPEYFNAKLAAVDGIRLTSDGSDRNIGSQFGVGGAWEYMTIKPDCWSQSLPGGCWAVHFDETTCDRIVQLCRRNPKLRAIVLFRLADWILNLFKYSWTRIP